MADKKWKREISAGGVVYKKDNGKIEILLIQTSGKSWKEKNIVWTFPKGKLDDQPPEEAALREVKEEAGVDAKIVENLGSVKFNFVWEGENIFKIVTYYLMEYVSGDPKDHDFEVAEARWYKLNDAGEMLKYKTDKEIFEKAKKLLRG